MQLNFYSSQTNGTVPVTRDDDRPDILRVDNCSEVDVAGNFYKQEEKYYEYCCDLENDHAPECADPGSSRISNPECVGPEYAPWWSWLILAILFVPWVIVGTYIIGKCLFCFCDCVKNCFNKCYNASCACCEPQPIVRNDNNATRNGTERSNISTISVDSIFHEVIQEGLVDRLPRSKASVDQCTKGSKYFY